MITIGIDPGQTGAIAIMNNGKIKVVYDMPIMKRICGGGFEINANTLYNMIKCVPEDDEIIAIVEQVSARPKQGVTSMFHFGESFGVVKGVLGALAIPYGLVTSQRWKKHYSLIGKDKDASRTLAITRFPEIADRLTLKKHHGRADAILLAAFKTTEG